MCSHLYPSFQGSFQCGECKEGYEGNQTIGCTKKLNTCGDGVTICNGHANCVMRRGYDHYICEVSLYCHSSIKHGQSGLVLIGPCGITTGWSDASSAVVKCIV
jgi:hypothetical protein